jgi:flagellar hook-associated protein 3 FlgL
MSAIPSNISRAPNMLVAQSSLATLTRTNLSLFRVQEQLSSGRAINRFSDDAVKAAAISILDSRIERSAQWRRNLDHAQTSLNTLDTALGDAHDLMLEARTIASAQVGTGVTAEERSAQAQVVDSLIQGMLGIANRTSPSGYIFSGSTPSVQAISPFLGGYRYNGRGPGLATDLNLGSTIPITLGAGNPIGATSGRVRGTADLNPHLTGDTRLRDLGGARGLGITLGVIEFSIDGGAGVPIDLTGADSAQAIADRITHALRDYEQANSATVLGPGGVSFSGGALSIDVAGTGSPALEFFDLSTGVTAQDLGLAGVTFSGGVTAGQDLQPRLTWRTPVSALSGVSGPLGAIRIRSLGQVRDVDLSAAATLEDIRNAIESAGLGLRVEINADGSGINVLNEVASSRAAALSIEEVLGNGMTATRLGIRTMSAQTRISDFNDGRGVQIVTGGANSETGEPDPTRDVDFEIRLGSGARFTVDLRPQDMATVQTVLDRINEQAATAGISVPGDFQAEMSQSANGIVLRQNSAFAAAIEIEPHNNSLAADQLGLMGLSSDGSGIFRGEDRARVRVDNVFSALIDLREALLNNDTIGITLAGERVEAVTDRLSQTRATVGAYARRVQDGVRQQEDQELIDQSSRSTLRDLDYTEAAVRLTMLQTQLQAGLHVTAQAFSRSLLDFLG